MFYKSWDKFWGKFTEMMAELPAVVNEACNCGATKVIITNGDIDIHGKFKSLKINGKKIRLPDGVLEG